MGITYLDRIRKRHLLGRGDTLSKFHCENVMSHCINMALNLPDFSYREKDCKYVHIKHFKFSVGHLGFAKRPTNKIKVVFGIEQHHRWMDGWMDGWIWSLHLYPYFVHEFSVRCHKTNF